MHRDAESYLAVETGGLRIKAMDTVATWPAAGVLVPLLTKAHWGYWNVCSVQPDLPYGYQGMGVKTVVPVQRNCIRESFCLCDLVQQYAWHLQFRLDVKRSTAVWPHL